MKSLSSIYGTTIFALLLLCLGSCSLTKGLADDQYIYKGAKIVVTDPIEARSIKEFKIATEAIPKTGTESGLFNIYTGLYNIYSTAGDEGFKHWVKYKLGKAPVIYDDQMLEVTEAKLQYYLIGKGFFRSSTKCDTTSKKRQVEMTCKIDLGPRYIIDSVIFPVDTTYTALKIDEQLRRLIVREGAYYNRDRLAYERSRTTLLAKNIGFADFREENIFFHVDTLKGNKVNIYMEVIQPTDSTYHSRYKLKDINIYPNYSIDKKGSRSLDTVGIGNNITVIESDHYINHRLLRRLIVEKTGAYYNKTNEARSISRLLDIGLFKFVNVNNIVQRQGQDGILSQQILLTPNSMQSISGELELNNRSGNIFGVGLSTAYTHRNVFRGAEQLKVTLSGLLETQFERSVSFINSSDLTVSIDLTFPRIILPGYTVREKYNFIPRTITNASFTRQRRTEFYTLRSISGRYGFHWKPNVRTDHQFYPIVISQFLVSAKSAEFEELLLSDQRLEQSFNNVLITGLEYDYSINTQKSKQDMNYNYFSAEIETSGNLISLLLGSDNESPTEIAGVPYAQFTKATIDFRNYHSVPGGRLASRFLAGAGYSYANSQELPYIKQYVAGGSNSLRAFRLRGVGPGAYVQDPSATTAFDEQFVDQTGDIRLEMNVEYRFPVFSYLKGALFVDAGNVWVFRDKDKRGGTFEFDTFYNQIAIGTGIGFRLDFEFFLIRLDLAFPLRAPIYNEGFQWVASEINPFSVSWRESNLRYNLGIGYPF